MTKYCVVDASNLMHRAKRVVRADEVDEVVGGCIDIFFRSMRKVFEKFGSDHAVVAFDHASWRSVVYSEYKGTRREAREADPREVEIGEAVFSALERLRLFLATGTRCTVLHQELCEGDDFIGRWVQLHPSDEHVIISTDSDYRQLVSDKVSIYDGVGEKLYNSEGIFYQDGSKPARGQDSREFYGETWKVKSLASADPYCVDPKWVLFEKVMLGDNSDNITRAAPPGMGPVKLKAAARDAVALQKLFDTLRKDLPDQPSVRELMERNEMLVDLSKQPAEVIELLDGSIAESVGRGPSGSVGAAFLIFCRENRLIRMISEADRFSRMLAKGY